MRQSKGNAFRKLSVNDKKIGRKVEETTRKSESFIRMKKILEFCAKAVLKWSPMRLKEERKWKHC